MEIDDIITLDDQNEYLILDKTTYEKEEYLLAVKLKENEQLTEDYVYLHSEKENESFYVTLVDDEDTMKVLTTLFTANQVAETIGEEQEA